MRRNAQALALVLLLPTGDEWSRFRGPGGQGVAAGEHAYPAVLDKEKARFATPVPAGHSSPCVWGDKIFLTGHEDEHFATLCIDREDGSVLWKKTVPAKALERFHDVNSPASPSPTTDGTRVFAYFGSFGLVCYDFAGEELWRRALPLPKNAFGTAASPILAGDRLVLNRDTNDDSFLLALEPATGETIWKVDRTGFPSGWSTPVAWKRGDVHELLVYGAFHLTAYDLADGTERWSVPGLADEPCTTPITGDGLVYVTSYNMRTSPEVIGLPDWEALVRDYDEDKNGTLSRDEAAANDSILSRSDADGEGDHPLRIFWRFLDGDKNGELDEAEWQKMSRWLGTFEHANALVAIRPGDGEKDAEIVWQEPRGVPECPSPVLYDGRVYMVKNGGLASCVDAATGQVKFRARTGARGPAYASLVAADGKIYSASARGVVTVLEAGDELKVLARNELEERIMATPALVAGTVYVRTAEHLYAFAQ
ncbi:MAG: PQQ-binding-like beta-propeller repeat protein [bacterium]|nr:PQQ-binding-like beta-propeller repeat protein [bacterium]